MVFYFPCLKCSKCCYEATPIIFVFFKIRIKCNYLNNKYGFKFIIETHSEYLVRQSQVFVAEQKYKDEKDLRDNNPFKVYFFPQDKDPYPMVYRTDGKFSNEFGTGFFDEANKLIYKIL